MNDVELKTAKGVDGEITTSGVVGVLAFIAHRRRQACCSCGWRGQCAGCCRARPRWTP